MAKIEKTSILTTKKLGGIHACPACGQEFVIEIQLELEPNADEITYQPTDPGSFAGNSKATLEVIAAVKGTRINHDCIPPVKRGPGRPPGKKVAGPAPEVVKSAGRPVGSDHQIEVSKAEAHRDRLREHDQLQRSAPTEGVAQ